VEELTSKLAGDPRFKSSLNPPALLVQSQKLLKGSALSVEEFSERSTRVTVAMDVLGRWETLNEQVNALLLQQQEFEANAAKLPEADQQKQQAVLKDTGEALQKLWQDLWIKELPTALQEMGSRVDQVKESLKRLKLPPGTPQVTPAMALESMIPLHSFGLPAPQAAGARRPVLAAPHGFWAELGHWFWNLGLWLRSVFVTDLLLILIALALASFFQLNSTYLGHSWGEPKDYIAAFIAGYGSQGLVSILDAITGRQLASVLQNVVKR
jgi:hypothetical protein